MDIYKDIVGWTKRLLNPKSGIPRKGILIFTRFIREAENWLPKFLIVRLLAVLLQRKKGHEF